MNSEAERNPLDSWFLHEANPPSRFETPDEGFKLVHESAACWVYKVMNDATQRVDIHKYLNPSSFGPAGFWIALREARALASVRHRNVAVIHGFSILTDSPERCEAPGLILEHVAGRNLHDLLVSRAKVSGTYGLGQREVADVGVQIAGGLIAVHAQGIIHRDVKPANIVIEDGTQRAVLIDFGLAVKEGGDEAVYGGTRGFAAPEQLVPRFASITQRSDIFGLAATMAWLLTGECPYWDALTAEDSGLSPAAALARELRPISERRPDIDSELAANIERALSKDPERRPSSMGEFQKGLLSFLGYDSASEIPQIEIFRVEKTPTGSMSLPLPHFAVLLGPVRIFIKASSSTFRHLGFHLVDQDSGITSLLTGSDSILTDQPRRFPRSSTRSQDDNFEVTASFEGEYIALVVTASTTPLELFSNFRGAGIPMESDDAEIASVSVLPADEDLAFVDRTLSAMDAELHALNRKHNKPVWHQVVRLRLHLDRRP